MSVKRRRRKESLITMASCSTFQLGCRLWYTSWTILSDRQTTVTDRWSNSCCPTHRVDTRPRTQTPNQSNFAVSHLTSVHMFSFSPLFSRKCPPHPTKSYVPHTQSTKCQTKQYFKQISERNINILRTHTRNFPRVPLASRVWATKSLSSVSSSADILNHAKQFCCACVFNL